MLWLSGALLLPFSPLIEFTCILHDLGLFKPLDNWGINLSFVPLDMSVSSVGLWGREKVEPGRVLVPMTYHAAPLCRAAHCPLRRWGARLLMTAHWARSPTSWWSHGLICTSVKSAALWAIPAPEVSLRQMGRYLRWWERRGKFVVATARPAQGEMVLILAFMVNLFCSSSCMCILPLLSLSNSIALFYWLVLNRSVLTWFILFPCLLPSFIFDYSPVPTCKCGHTQVTFDYPGHL